MTTETAPAAPTTFATVIARYADDINKILAIGGQPVAPTTDTLTPGQFVDMVTDARKYLDGLRTKVASGAAEELQLAENYLSDALGSPAAEQALLLTRAAKFLDVADFIAGEIHS